MPLLQLVGTLVVVGVLLWAMNTYLPMDPKIGKMINLVVVVAVVLWLLKVFGVIDQARGIRIGAAQTESFAGVSAVLGEGATSYRIPPLLKYRSVMKAGVAPSTLVHGRWNSHLYRYEGRARGRDGYLVW